MSDYWENKARENNEDFATKKFREDLKMDLTNKQYANLKLMAYKAGFSDSTELLASFVGDLTGWQVNGSDEMEMASNWYERAFSHEYFMPFRYHLFNYDYALDSMKDMLDDDGYFDEVYEEYREEAYKRDIETKDQCLEVLRKIVDGGNEL